MTADELAARLLDAGAFPTRADMTTQKIIDEANSEMVKRLIPLFRKMQGGFLVDSVDYPVVANQAIYAIPVRAVTSGIELIKYIDANGNDVAQLQVLPLRLLGKVQGNWTRTDTSTVAYPTCFRLTADSIVLAPVPTTAIGSLRVYYARRPGKLVSDVVVASQHTQVGTISSVLVDTITLNANHNGFPANALVDIVQALPPHRVIAKDLATTTAAVGTATVVSVGVAAAYPSIVAGDYLTLARTTYVPELPEEWHELLLDLTIAKFYRKVGNWLAANELAKQVAESAAGLLSATLPRAQQSGRYLNPFG